MLPGTAELTHLSGGDAACLPVRIVRKLAADVTEAYAELIRRAAQGDVVFNDDTYVKILELMSPEARQRALSEDSIGDVARAGMFTSGVVSTCNGLKIALYFSGHQHAGENLQALLRQRAAELEPPIQMCDALSRNIRGDFKTIVANCIAHARRKFVDVHDRFPKACRVVLKSLKERENGEEFHPCGNLGAADK